MTKSGLEDLIKSMSISEETQKAVDEVENKSIQRYKNAVFNKNKIELNYGKSEYVSNDMWLAYLHYSKEQHQILAKNGCESKELREHVRQHGQLVKNG